MSVIQRDTPYNAQRNQELAIFRKCRRLEEERNFWKGTALFACALLFFVVCFCVAYGW